MGFPSKYQNGLPLPSLGNLSGQGTEPKFRGSHALAGGFFNQVTEKAHPGAPLRPLQKPLRLLSQGATSDTG